MSADKILEDLEEIASAYEQITGNYWLLVEVPEQKMFLAGWIASRSAIEVELPKKYESDYGAGIYQDDEGDLYLVENVVESIKSLGLKVKQ